jgi:hypothetical protein
VTHLLILTPSLARVSIAWSDTYALLVLECSKRGIKVTRADATDPGLLPHARNVLLAEALKSEATHALWWDADVAFDVAGLFELLERPEPMICRPYPMRGTDFDALRDYLLDNLRQHSDGNCPTVEELRNASMLWSVSIHYENGAPVWSDDGVLLRVDHTGFGWVLHKVGSLRRFVEHTLESDGAIPKSAIHRIDWHHRQFIPAFDHAPNDQDIWQGEDVSFCQLWRMSAPIWAAPDRFIKNGGRVGKFSDYLEQHGIARAT